MEAELTNVPTEPICIDSDRESTESDEDSCKTEPLKKQNMFIWSQDYDKWHECVAEWHPAALQITEYEDQKLEVNENQLRHLSQDWYFGSLSRREARVILQDFQGGTGSFLVRASESFQGKFAVSFVHETSVKHVVIESTRDPVAGAIYNITPSGPIFSSLYELIQEAQQTPLIQNHIFSVQLTCSPPKPDTTWLHKGVKSLSQAELILRREHRDGAFFVYGTQSEYAPYIVLYRSNGSILHNLIVHSNQSNGGYTLNNVTSQVLYKVIHYFMENPIHEKTVLRYPVPDRTPTTTNCGIALQDYMGDTDMNELSFAYGALLRNIHDKSREWSIGDHRGDKQKYFKRGHVRLLTRDELEFVNNQKTEHRARSLFELDQLDSTNQCVEHSHSLCLHSSYKAYLHNTTKHGQVLLIEVEDSEGTRQYKLSCSSSQDLETWYHLLQKQGTSASNSTSSCLIPRLSKLPGKSSHQPPTGTGRSKCTIS